MENVIITQLHGRFEDSAREHEGVEYGFARDLQGLLGYTEWPNFLKVVDKAMEACKGEGQLGQLEKDHFVGVNKMVDLGSTNSWPRVGIAH